MDLNPSIEMFRGREQDSRQLMQDSIDKNTTGP